MLVEPDYEKNNLYNLSSSIAEDIGIKRDGMIPSDELNMDKGRVLLILVDGLGYNILEKAGLVDDRVKKFKTVFPSTTSTALTSLYTVTTPGQHGILGFTTYTKNYGVIQTLKYTLPEVSDTNLIKKISGIGMGDMFNVKSIGKEIREKGKKANAIIPECIVGTELSKMLYGVSKPIEYKTLWDAVYLTKQALESKPVFLTLYLPFVDTLAHKYGPYSEPTINAARYIYKKLIESFEDYSKDYDIIITADHGLIDVKENHFLDQDRDLIDLLDAPPYGDARAIFMRSRFDLKEKMKSMYNNLVTFSKEDMINKGLLSFKGEKLSSAVSDYLSVPNDEDVFVYRYKGNYSNHKGHHGALLKEEMEIPVIKL